MNNVADLQRFQRPISATERIWVCYDTAFGSYANQCVIEGTGNLDLERLSSAVQKASEANPGSRLVLKGSLRSCCWIDSGITPRVRTIPGEQWDGRGPENAPFLHDPLPFSGPTCEVIHLTGPIPRLIFRSNHGVMDGMGTLTWMEDIFRVCRGENPLGSTSRLTEYSIARSVTDQTMKMHPIESIAPTGKAGRGRPGMTWKRVTVPGKHSMVMGTIGWALAQSSWRYGDGVIRIGIPVDERHRMNGERSTGNLSMAIYVTISRNSTPESITKEIRKQLENNRDCVSIEGGNYLDLIPIRLISLGVKLLAWAPYRIGKYSVSALISNLGRLDTDAFSFAGFKANAIFFIPPRLEGLPAFVVLSGRNDRFEMTVSVPSVLTDNGRFERLLRDLQIPFGNII